MDLPPSPSPREPYPAVPTPRPAAPTRPGLVTGAGAILLVSGFLNLLVGAISAQGGATFVMPGGGVGGDAVAFVLVGMGVLQLLAGWLVLRLRQAGRILAIVLATLGIVAGLLQLGSSGATGLLSILLNAFVLYGVLAYAFVFEQASSAR
jgi:hypothetical protein